jgi:hypothetical protein
VNDLVVHFPRREIVEKEERASALNQDVVDAVVDEALTDRVVSFVPTPSALETSTGESSPGGTS